MEVEDNAWTQEALALWTRIEAHPFENPSITLDFTGRLARQLGWPLETARQAVAEYRRFCFLAMVTRNGPVTPSEEVDEVWHLHLTFTRDYWERWCGGALGRPLHHDPTKGGPVENARYRAQYAETLALYERFFGPPPETFWPGTAQRFAGAPRYRQVDGTRVLVLPRPRLPRGPLLAGLFALLWSTPASAQMAEIAARQNILDWSGGPFLALYIPLLVVAVAVASALSAGARRTGRRADARGLDAIAIAYLVGGRGRAADALILEMAVAGRARIEPNAIVFEQNPRDAPDRLQPFGSLPPGRYRRAELVRLFAGSPREDAVRQDLSLRNLFLSPRRALLTKVLVLAPTVLAFLLGLAKLITGLSRDKPVGFLELLLAICFFVTLHLLKRDGGRTQAGNAIVSDLRSDRSRAVRAPLQAELPLAFAVLGATALTGSDYSPLAAQISTSGGGGDSSSGCGGGDGGGGCGGCGGGGD